MILKDCCLECFHLNLEVNFHLNLFPGLIEREHTKACKNVQLREDGGVPFINNMSLRVFQMPLRTLLTVCRLSSESVRVSSLGKESC